MKALLGLILLASLSISSFTDENTTEIDKAISLYDKASFAESKKIFIKLYEDNVCDERIPYYLGLIEYESKNFPKAEEYFLEAIALDSSYSEAYNELASIKINQRLIDEGLQYVELALKYDDHNAGAYLNYSSILSMQGKDDESKKNVYKAAEIDPMRVMGHGLKFLSLGDFNSAYYYLRIVEEIYPSEPIVLMNIGNLLRHENYIENGLEYLKYAYEFAERDYPTFDVIYSSYFRTLFDLGRYDSIVNHVFDKVNGEYASAYFFLSIVYFKLDNSELFIRNAEKYFELESLDMPESPEKWAAMIIGKHGKQGN